MQAFSFCTPTSSLPIEHSPPPVELSKVEHSPEPGLKHSTIVRIVTVAIALLIPMSVAIAYILAIHFESSHFKNQGIRTPSRAILPEVFSAHMAAVIGFFTYAIFGTGLMIAIYRMLNEFAESIARLEDNFGGILGLVKTNLLVLVFGIISNVCFALVLLIPVTVSSKAHTIFGALAFAFMHIQSIFMTQIIEDPLLKGYTTADKNKHTRWLFRLFERVAFVLMALTHSTGLPHSIFVISECLCYCLGFYNAGLLRMSLTNSFWDTRSPQKEVHGIRKDPLNRAECMV